MSFRDKIAQRIQLQDDEVPLQEENEQNIVEPFVKSRFFSVATLGESPACLRLDLSNGDSKGIPYSYIVDLNYSRSEGIEIISSIYKVTITGRKLRLLFNYLAAYRVKHIEANIGTDLEGESVLFIKNIKIEEV